MYYQYISYFNNFIFAVYSNKATPGNTNKFFKFKSLAAMHMYITKENSTWYCKPKIVKITH